MVVSSSHYKEMCLKMLFFHHFISKRQSECLLSTGKVNTGLFAGSFPCPIYPILLVSSYDKSWLCHYGLRFSVEAEQLRAPLRILDSVSGVSDQQSVGSSPGHGICVDEQDTFSIIAL